MFSHIIRNGAGPFRLQERSLSDCRKGAFQTAGKGPKLGIFD